MLLQHAQPGQGGNETSPMEYVWRAEPIKVHGAVVASYGSELHLHLVVTVLCQACALSLSKFA